MKTKESELIPDGR